ncbi:hypothetical protein A5753_03790 [Mycobacterium sp. 852002-51971_SCH5477799-a]|nr:hypothetical protein A5753_03790 [Mycobacterium sp. 852002-51971_SCH5477799-a]
MEAEYPLTSAPPARTSLDLNAAVDLDDVRDYCASPRKPRTGRTPLRVLEWVFHGSVQRIYRAQSDSL